MSKRLNKLQLIDVRGAARVLGIKEDTLRHWIWQQRFPYVKVGRRTMIAIRDLEHLVAENRVEPDRTEQQD